MRHDNIRSKKWQHRVGLATMLLIAAVCGEVMAPMSSEAQIPNASRPTLTIQVTFGTSTTSQNIPINPTPVTCSSIQFNYCYELAASAYTTFYGPVGHQFSVQNYSGTALVRVNVNDVPTSSNTNPSDVIIVTGLKLVPATSWSSLDNVIIKLIVKQKFDAQPNSAADGVTKFYPFGISVGGTFATNPSPAGNYYQMYGTGIFETNGTSPFGPASGQPKNIANQFNPHADFTPASGTADTKCYGVPLSSAGGTKYPMCQYIAGATSTQASFSSQQNSAYYPGGSTSVDTTTKFKCTNNRTGTNKQVIDPRGVTRTYNDPSCQPEITETHKFSIQGPDQIAFTTSSHGGGGVCSDESGGGGPPLPSCLCTTTQPNKASVCNAIKSLHAKAKNDEDIENNITGAQPVIECDDVICSGILNLNISVTNNPPVGTVFPFKVLGPAGGVFTITTTANGSGVLNPPLDHLITGHGGAEGGPAPLAVLPDYDNPAWPRPDANSYYEVDQFQVASLNGSTILDTDTQIVNCSGGHKGPVLINAIGRSSSGQGDTVTVGIHIHKAQSPPAVCPF